uniref:Uroplakin 2 n=1 Tax=Canis lupus familiaris TaxID=9615 RepID=A0A8C0ME20_CANLF
MVGKGIGCPHPELPLGPPDFNISSVSGLLSPALTESLLVALPPCHLTGGNATLMVRRANDSKVVKSSFVVPSCRGRRELVSVVDSGAGFTVTRLSAYQVTNLVPGTKYYISYLVRKGSSTESSREIPMSTLPRKSYQGPQIFPGPPTPSPIVVPPCAPLVSLLTRILSLWRFTCPLTHLLH